MSALTQRDVYHELVKLHQDIAVTYSRIVTMEQEIKNLIIDRPAFDNQQLSDKIDLLVNQTQTLNKLLQPTMDEDRQI